MVKAMDIKVRHQMTMGDRTLLEITTKKSKNKRITIKTITILSKTKAQTTTINSTKRVKTLTGRVATMSIMRLVTEEVVSPLATTTTITMTTKTPKPRDTKSVLILIKIPIQLKLNIPGPPPAIDSFIGSFLKVSKSNTLADAALFEFA